VASEETKALSDEADVANWIKYAQSDRRAAQSLFASGDYSVCAEMCQHMLEKILKALIVFQTGERPPYEHNLKRLADMVTGIAIPSRIVDILLNVSPHYRFARYPGFGDLSLYTAEYTRNLLDEAEEAYGWFLQQIK